MKVKVFSEWWQRVKKWALCRHEFQRVQVKRNGRGFVFCNSCGSLLRSFRAGDDSVEFEKPLLAGDE